MTEVEPDAVGADAVEAEAPATRSNRQWWRLGLAVLAALLVGYGLGWVTPSLTAPGDNSADAGFARDMSTHHAQAVDMGTIIYPKATTPEVRIMAIDVALTQENQIGQLKAWLQVEHLSANSSNTPMSWMPNGSAELHDGLMPGMATTQQMDALKAATGQQADILFLQLMINHHLGGIHMVDGYLALSDNDQLRDLAQGMKANQSAEIDQMKELLTQLGAKPMS